MLQYFFDRWESQGGTTQNIIRMDSYKLNLKPCIHCGHCKTTFGCVYDDFIPVHNALCQADILIIASPVYCLGFPAPVKAILDRTQQYFEAKFSLGITKPIDKYKKAYFFTAHGSDKPSGISTMEDQLRLIFRVLNANLEKTIIAPHTDKTPLDTDALKNDMEEIVTSLRKPQIRLR
jgi:multimeric flavodoxin WrbA